jgi:hypothetical protein
MWGLRRSTACCLALWGPSLRPSASNWKRRTPLGSGTSSPLFLLSGKTKLVSPDGSVLTAGVPAPLTNTNCVKLWRQSVGYFKFCCLTTLQLLLSSSRHMPRRETLFSRKHWMVRSSWVCPVTVLRTETCVQSPLLVWKLRGIPNTAIVLQLNLHTAANVT